MQEEHAKKIFQDILSSPQNTLQGHLTLKSALTSDPKLLTQIVELLSNTQQIIPEQQLQHFHIITLLHPVLIDLFDQLGADTQDEIRSGLLSVIVAQQNNLKAVGALALLVREMLQSDSVDPWVEPLGELMNWAQSQELPIMLAGIEFFLHLHRQTTHTRSNCDTGLYKLAPVLLQKMFAVFASPQLDEHNRAKLLCLVLQIIKSFSPLDGVEDSTVRHCFEGTFDLWMSMFVTALQGTLNLNLPIKKYILKILVVIFRDMQRFLTYKKYHKPAHLFTIWEFTYRLIPLYLWTHVWGYDSHEYPPQPRTTSTGKDQDYLNYDDQSDALCSTVEALALAALDFISVLMSVPQLQGALRVSAHHITNAIFHYLLISNDEQAGWKTNAQHFNAQLGSLQYQTGVRGRCLSILNQMIEKFQNLSIQAILVAGQKFLLNLPQSSTNGTFSTILHAVVDDLEALPNISSGLFQSETHLLSLAKLSSVDIRAQLEVSGETWHKVETALLVLGRFSEDIIVFQSNQGGTFDIESFVQGIMKQVREQDYYSLLKGQSLFCLTRFIEIISIKYRHLFTQLFSSAISCNLPGAPLSLRTVACKAASSFLKKLQKHKLQISNDTLAFAEEMQIIERVCEIPLLPDTTATIIESLVEMCKARQLKSLNRPPAAYFLALFHQCLTQQHLIPQFLVLLDSIISDVNTFGSLAGVFLSFTGECLKAYLGAIRSDQKRLLKSADTQLIITSLQVANTFISKASHMQNCEPQKELMIQLFVPALDIMDINEDVPLQVAFSLFLKNIIRTAPTLFAERKQLTEQVIQLVRLLLRIPKDKSFQSASIYAGNLAVVLFDRILGKKHNEILQQIVLKVFRSRTPSVIQSLVLAYARIINQGVTPEKKFVITGEQQTRAKDVVDFLSSFSIENRMGLKILVDKWLLQQSLFRGKFTKTATFMALSRLFLLSDKRVDNLLVIGFNPSHTNVNNDVNAPLKIMATLIRCLDNQLAGPRGTHSDDQEDQGRMQPKEEGLAVDLQKFKEQQPRPEQRVGGSLADRQNQQGSTCYMSAMLQFYDDGEQCDDKTEQDLIYLQDSSLQFDLSDYLKDFFGYLVQNRNDYFKECIKGLLKQDVRTLQKYIKF